MLLKSERDGELFVDHRASPGMPEAYARGLGLAGNPFGEGRAATIPTIGCVHCHTPQILNPQRTRDRAWCRSCDAYICDYCDAARREPGYVHLTFREIMEKVQSGQYVVFGSVHRPRLVHVSELGAMKLP